MRNILLFIKFLLFFSEDVKVYSSIEDSAIVSSVTSHSHLYLEICSTGSVIIIPFESLYTFTPLLSCNLSFTSHNVIFTVFWWFTSLFICFLQVWKEKRSTQTHCEWALGAAIEKVDKHMTLFRVMSTRFCPWIVWPARWLLSLTDPWWISPWCFKLLYRVNEAGHCSHWNGFGPRWDFSCTARLRFSLKPDGHNLQWKGFSPEPIWDFSWFFMDTFDSKAASHNCHWKGFSPLWFLLWVTRLPFLSVVQSHKSHWNFFSFPIMPSLSSTDSTTAS